ncbi:MAG: hypothetical protein Ct9H300mP13_1980 [Gammaproteobacteria bacterium]|nr:MAG: hypothetical protein Ct9H300mP13_1980 [Gammaproteobacteria bacterium]
MIPHWHIRQTASFTGISSHGHRPLFALADDRTLVVRSRARPPPCKKLASNQATSPARTIVMGAYIIRRLLLIIPTLSRSWWSISQYPDCPRGPVEQVNAQLTGTGADITERVTRSGTSETLDTGRGNTVIQPTPGHRGWILNYQGTRETVWLRQTLACSLR